jgi:hypothetical protein
MGQCHPHAKIALLMIMRANALGRGAMV